MRYHGAMPSVSSVGRRSSGNHDSRILTRLRQAVLDILVRARQPLTAYEVLESLQAQRAATPAGVYRTLHYLIAQGLVHRIASRKAFVACQQAGHAHINQFLMCRLCGGVTELAGGPVVSVADDQGKRSGFLVETGTLELSGVCKPCRVRASAATKRLAVQSSH